MSKPKIAIIGGDSLYRELAAKFADVVEDYDDADIVMFTGGSDVSPSLYGENQLKQTQTNYLRDVEEVSIFERLSARTDKKRAFVGICRGGQFLNVMNGGTLWQHVEGHTKAHSVVDLETNKVYHVSSTHHQMFRLPEPLNAVPYKVLAVALEDDSQEKRTGTSKLTASKDRIQHDGEDYEAVWYPNTRSLCFQPHPEYTPFVACRELFLSYVGKHVLPSLQQ